MSVSVSVSVSVVWCSLLLAPIVALSIKIARRARSSGPTTRGEAVLSPAASSPPAALWPRGAADGADRRTLAAGLGGGHLRAAASASCSSRLVATSVRIMA